TWTDCQAALAPANANGFVVADSDNAGNIYLAYGEQARFHTYLVILTAANVSKCDNPVVAGAPIPTNNPGFSQPLQVDRDAVRSGDRTVADFFSLDFNAVSKKLDIIFNRTNKLPNESLGHIATPLVMTQTAGPTNDGATLGTSPAVPVVRTSSSDPGGDALS